MAPRPIERVAQALETSDGAGVRIKRALGAQPELRLDPFLMLDEFGSDSASDYIAGFPNHPHRGFETVTYMLEGHMLHEDHLGNRGNLKSGDVQWMTAGRGIIHSEMPQQDAGRMRGFQLWLNLPAHAKMCEPSYRDIPAQDIPNYEVEGGRVKVIAGKLDVDDQRLNGAIDHGSDTDPVYADIALEPSRELSFMLDPGHAVALYVYDGTLNVVANDAANEIPPAHLAVLGEGDQIVLRTDKTSCRALILAGKPIGEPVVQYGPFVMNSRSEIEQALKDYQRGVLTEPPH